MNSIPREKSTLLCTNSVGNAKWYTNCVRLLDIYYLTFLVVHAMFSCWSRLVYLANQSQIFFKRLFHSEQNLNNNLDIQFLDPISQFSSVNGCSFKHACDDVSVQSLLKIPQCIAIIIVEEVVSINDVANLIMWSREVGLKYVTLYDPKGVIKSGKVKLESLIQDRSGAAALSRDIVLKFYEKGVDPDLRKARPDVCEVLLMDPNDCSIDITQSARALCKKVAAKDITVDDITAESLEEHFVFNLEPELLVKFGPLDSLLGFLPWHIRLTEMIFLPTHQSLVLEDYIHIFRRYSKCVQRFGK